MNKGLPTLPISRNRLREGPAGHAGRLDFPEDWGPEGFTLRRPPRVVVTAEESRGGAIQLTGTLTAELAERCSRCLEPAEREREVEIDLRFEPELDPWDEGPQLYALEANREEIDIGPALREELILALPEYPLCDPDCRGLCPRCGQDLNEAECDCEEETGDPRWDALRRQLETSGPPAQSDENDETTG